MSDLIERAKLFSAGHKPWTECYPIMRELITETERLTAAYAEMLVELHAEIDLLIAELAKAKCSCGLQGGHTWDCPANPNRQAAEAAKEKP